MRRMDPTRTVVSTLMLLGCLLAAPHAMMAQGVSGQRVSTPASQGLAAMDTAARFAEATEIVTLDPGDQQEASCLRELQVPAGTPQAVTVVLAPPGQPIAKFAGPVGKDQIVAKVASAQSGPCAGGKCGPGGCGPKR